MTEVRRVEYGEFLWHLDETHVMHRHDGPAVKHPTHQEWFKNVGGAPKCHRADGPARMFKIAPDGQKLFCEWWLEGKFQMSSVVDEETFNKYWEDD